MRRTLLQRRADRTVRRRGLQQSGYPGKRVSGRDASSRAPSRSTACCSSRPAETRRSSRRPRAARRISASPARTAISIASQSTRLILDPSSPVSGAASSSTTARPPRRRRQHPRQRAGGDYLDLVGDEREMIRMARYERTASVDGGGALAPGAVIAHRLDIGRGIGSTCLPVGGTPALLGLRLSTSRTSSSATTAWRSNAEMKLGDAAPV